MWENEITIYRGYRFRIYPTEEQTMQLEKIFSTVHFVYNTLCDHWKEDARLDFQCELERLIAQESWLHIIHRSILNNTARQLEQACRQCEELHQGTRGRQASGTRNIPDNNMISHESGMPRKKLKHDAYASFTLSSRNIRIHDGKLYLGEQEGIRPLKLKESRSIPASAQVFSVTISRKSSEHYYASLVCRMRICPGTGICRALPESHRGSVQQNQISAGRRPHETGATIKAVGLDFSLVHLFIASDPELATDEQYLHRAKASHDRLAAANRNLAKMQYMSHNFQKERARIARISERIANQRQDYLQKLSTRISDEYDVVCVETLDLIEMEQTCHGYARKVADSGWADFVRMLEYKLKERGKDLIRVDKWYASSRICHECSYVNHVLTVNDREWICPVCGAKLDRDKNASLNIRDEGLRILRNRRRRNREERSPEPALYDREGSYHVGTSPSEVRPEADNQMSRFWGQGPYGWEYRGCAWDAQFYVSRMDRDEIAFDESRFLNQREVDSNRNQKYSFDRRADDAAIAKAPGRTFYVEDEEPDGMVRSVKYNG